MRKKITVVCSHHSIDKDTGYGRAFELYYALSKKYDINVIVPREIDIFKDEKIALNSHMTMQMIAVDKPVDTITPIWKYYEKMCENDALINNLKKTSSESDFIICDSIYYVSLARKAFPDKYIVYRGLEIIYNQICSLINYSEIDQKTETDWKDITYNFEKKACNDADFIFELTQHDADCLCELYELNNSKVGVIPVCFNDAELLENYLPPKRKSSLKFRGLLINAYGLSEHKKIFEAFAKIPDVEFHVVGKVGKYINNYPQNVIIHGIVSKNEKQRIANLCDFAINISDMNFGQNVKVMDYFLSGIPVIANELGVRGYNVCKNVEYFHAELDTLDQDIIKFCNLSVSERYSFALNAFCHVCSKFKNSNFIPKFDKLFGEYEKVYEYYIFGAGGLGKLAFSEAQISGFRCIGFIDNDVNRQGSEYLGKMIFSPEQAFEDINRTENKKVIIGVDYTNLKAVFSQIIENVESEKIMVFEKNADCIFSMDVLDIKKISKLIL